MYPLIEITTVPIELEVKTTRAKLEHVRGTADLEISRQKGGFHIKSRPIKLNLDTFEARNSIMPTAMRSIEQNAQRGRQAAYEATAIYADQGHVLLSAKIGEEMITQFAADAQARQVQTNVGLQFLPNVGVEMDWTPAQLDMRFELDKLNFDWRTDPVHFEFTPGDIELTVTQYPSVNLKYVGGPLYVPRSSDPNYVPLDAEA